MTYDSVENARRAKYLAAAVTRNHKGAIAALVAEFGPEEAKRIEVYQKTYRDPTAPGHQQMVDDVQRWYEAACTNFLP